MLLIGCPQLLDGDFVNSPPLSAAGSAGAGGASPLSGMDAGAGGGGRVGAGGNAGLSAGGSNVVLGGASGTGGAGAAGGLANDGGGVPPADASEPGPGAALAAVLLHRYGFDTAGSVIADSVGSANGTAIGAQVVAGSGKITLSGNDQYVDLPNGLISGLESVTLEAWVNWAADPISAAADWQTIFSFGASENTEGNPGNAATTYVFLTAKSGDSDDIRSGYTLTGFNTETRSDGTDPLPLSSDAQRGTHVAMVVDAAERTLSMYVNGVLAASPPTTLPVGEEFDLSAINDINNWLGRSQFASDPEFAGDLLEFRIYGAALDATLIGLSFELGPDTDL